MIEKMLGFVMVLTRLSAFFLVVPIFGSKVIPRRIKVAIILVLTAFFSMISPFQIDPKGVSILEAVIYLSNEAIYGLALAMIVVILFSVIKISGRIIERQMGFAMAETLDPLSGERSQPLGTLLDIMFVLLFLSANGHHFLLAIISKSYSSFPVGSIPTIELMLEGIIEAGSTMLTAGLRVAAPLLAAFIILLVILAILSRMMPDMNILFISFPMRIGLGLLIVGMMMPIINGYISEFADWMEQLIPL